MGYLDPTPPPEPSLASDARVAELNRRYRRRAAIDVMRGVLRGNGKAALVSSFGAESVVLLHMLALTDRMCPVLFLDTEMLFTETLVYQQEVTARLGLQNLQIIRSDEILAEDPDGTLHRRNADACCALRKTRPLKAALAPFDAWITGRKRFQSGSRAGVEHFEVEPGSGRIKVNPLAYWSRADVQTYMTEHELPRHPLVDRGYPSIGCAPCTSPAGEDEDPRAGRWRNHKKDECGIHYVNGKFVRTGAFR